MSRYLLTSLILTNKKFCNNWIYGEIWITHKIFCNQGAAGTHKVKLLYDTEREKGRSVIQEPFCNECTEKTHNINLLCDTENKHHPCSNITG
ncbi:hypothetical protein DPMN_048093 [Dreissena polymorpha]|uniref:Uncharacterized protein n=1 Tax=Dreissena polymorpha TaxID=45954 RepID=A0A9D4I232_DREPO|nr:hypothetical protein DPMN_048093 [Dreissena polymorpha]